MALALALLAVSVAIADGQRQNRRPPTWAALTFAIAWRSPTANSLVCSTASSRRTARQAALEKHNSFLKELGLPTLP